MKKVLFVATVTKHINAFHIPYLKWFKEQGYEVHVASNVEEEIPYCDKHFNLNFARFPIKLQNFKVYKELKKIIDNNQYEIVHCHTPVGGVLTRIAAKNSRKKYSTKVIYTAHGFHFYKGAPVLNWIIYYPIEKALARYTDCLITINNEDYNLARRKFNKSKEIRLVHGVGFNSERLNVSTQQNYREELECKEDDIVLSYIAEINDNKNQILLLNCMETIVNQFSNVKLLLIGSDSTEGKFEKHIKEKQLESNVKLLGNRDDIGHLLSITDIYVASSLREGLPVNIMEAMYKKLPIVALDNRGHRALIQNGKNGFIVNNKQMMTERIVELIKNENLRKQIGEEAFKETQKYQLENVKKEMIKIYKKIEENNDNETD